MRQPFCSLERASQQSTHDRAMWSDLGRPGRLGGDGERYLLGGRAWTYVPLGPQLYAPSSVTLRKPRA